MFDQKGESFVVDAQLIIAATGRSSGAPLLPVETGQRLPEMIALSAIVDSPDTDDDASVIEAVREGWIWWLPFGDGRASVALFCDPSEIRDRGRAEVWKSALGQSQGAAHDFDKTSTRGTLATARSHHNDGGLLIAGDAISAIDPLSSQGLEKAFVSAEETALAAETALLGEADLKTMVDQRQRWELRLFRMHRQRALAIYHAETRFEEHPFWAARHQLDIDPIQAAARPTGRLTPAAGLTQEPRWIRSGNRLVPRPAIRLCDSDEESIDQVGQVPTGVILGLVGDELPMHQLAQRAATVPALIDQSPASLSQILGEMCRLELLIEN
ncbi:MAG: tryptophan 7-halogenase [Planctomycetes bacterium]|nr:tryptophan 7-halogenase [Planctomycetota bacterium]